MKVTPTFFPEVLLLEPTVYGDERGYFYESFNHKTFSALTGIDALFVQDNHSYSKQNVIRGLHYQIQNPQGKLVRVLDGEVFDVVVDVRKSSPTFGRWIGIVLSAQNRLQLWIPPGFAHGFAALSAHAQFLYKTTDYWAPQFERTILWSDADIGIDWPLDAAPIVAPKDRQGKRLHEAEVYP